MAVLSCHLQCSHPNWSPWFKSRLPCYPEFPINTLLASRRSQLKDSNPCHPLGRPVRGSRLLAWPSPGLAVMSIWGIILWFEVHSLSLFPATLSNTFQNYTCNIKIFKPWKQSYLKDFFIACYSLFHIGDQMFIWFFNCLKFIHLLAVIHINRRTQNVISSHDKHPRFTDLTLFHTDNTWILVAFFLLPLFFIYTFKFNL